MRLSEEIFVCVDCETTGLDTKEDVIIEVGAVRFTLGNVLDRFESLIDPERPIPEESTKIHNITDTMVAGKPKIAEVLPGILAFLKEGTIIGHGIGFDIAMLAESAKRASIPCDLNERPTIDTLRLARLYGESPSNSLENLRKHFNIPPESAHRAMDDAYINSEVFMHLVRPFTTLKEVYQALSKPIRLKTMPLGKHKGRPFTDIPETYLRWAASKDFDQDLLFSIRSELKQRKSKNRFQTSPFGGL